MSELKIYNMDNTSLHDMCNSNFYLKSEADLCVCFGLQDNDENLLQKCKKCKALVWNAEELIIKRMNEVKQ